MTHHLRHVTLYHTYTCWQFPYTNPLTLQENVKQEAGTSNRTRPKDEVHYPTIEMVDNKYTLATRTHEIYIN